MPTTAFDVQTENVQFKAINGALSVDEAKGIVECFVAGIGNKDSVGDIIVPGAFDESLKRRKPRVVWGHDWNQPIGKVLEIVEVGPNDPRLPAKMKAAGIGGLYARVQFNLKSERGREAFANILFFGEDQEWSIGYKTHDAVYDTAKQANILKVLELYEVSPVLHGANQLTGTISIKSDAQSGQKNVVRKAIAKESDTKCWNDGEMSDDSEDRFGEGESQSMAASPKMVALAIASKYGGSIRIREMSKNIVVFDQMQEGEVQTFRAGYHFDGNQFMFGEFEKVKPTTVYLPEEEEPDEGEVGEYENDTPYRVESAKIFGMEQPMENQKASVPTDAIPQERFTGDVLHGHGPRRGNLERLLRYWRPIMRREGGFRRCRVILADHPELYPLNNICAWLHHETTGLWPNEGCHHPGMKNCRNKLRNVMRGSIVSDSQFESRMRQLGGGKSAMMEDQYGDVTDEDIEIANKILQQFMTEEKDFMEYLSDENNWVHVGDDEDGTESEHPWMKPKGDCGCGGKCGGSGMKSDDDDLDFKAGRSISNSNMGKIQQAITLLQQVTAAGAGPIEMKKKSDPALLEHLAPVLEYHNIKVKSANSDEISIMNLSEVSDEGIMALNLALDTFDW